MRKKIPRKSKSALKEGRLTLVVRLLRLVVWGRVGCFIVLRFVASMFALGAGQSGALSSSFVGSPVSSRLHGAGTASVREERSLGWLGVDALG